MISITILILRLTLTEIFIVNQKFLNAIGVYFAGYSKYAEIRKFIAVNIIDVFNPDADNLS